MTNQMMRTGTGSTEGFFQINPSSEQQQQPQQNKSSTNNDSTDNTTSPPGEAKGKSSSKTGSLLRSPGELGVASPTPSGSATPERKPKQRWPSSSPALRKSCSGRERSLAAIKSTLTPAAAAAAAENLTIHTSHNGIASMVTSVSHRGMEVLFCTVRRDVVVGICPRTRVTLQTLDIPEGGTIVRLFSNPVTAMVAVTLADGTIQTYYPVVTCPRPEPGKVVAAFGRFRWMNGPRVSCKHIFGQGDDKQKTRDEFFHQSAVDVSSSSDHKLLVAHETQIGVFDVSPLALQHSPEEEVTAELVWTTRLDATIRSARISGDGKAIVVVCVGEGVMNKNPFGTRTFVRDAEDGSSTFVDASVATGLEMPEALRQRSTSSSGTFVGIVYKPGPFLIHEASVSRISFRGFGHNTSKVANDDEEGNDLLLTYCEKDSCVRVFSQNSWKQLMQWTSPPHTRADWVRGLSALNLGDLESSKKKNMPASVVSSRRPSIDSSNGNDSAGTAAFKEAMLGNRHFQSVPSHPSPSTAAGAWIAEVTFRSAYPALRLSRLSYMKRGNDDPAPAHFESVAAVLPTGSVISESVLSMGDMGIAVDGVWPAWTPWTSDSANSELNGTLSGSAMSFLGLSTSTPQPGSGYFGDSPLGGTHCPPSELRLVASHPLTGKVVMMEFPLWGDREFGAMELGSPLRYLLSLSDINGLPAEPGEKDDGITCSVTHLARQPQAVCLDYESSTLSARVQQDFQSIEVTWRKQGSMSLLPLRSKQGGSPRSVTWLSSIQMEGPDGKMEERSTFQDVSSIPIPLSLPTLNLPRSTGSSENEEISALAWWPDENYGGPPLLLAVTCSGSILLYEMPPPWSALEPAMPGYDPFSVSNNGSLAGSVQDQRSLNGVGSEESDDESGMGREYEVMITPHPDFGIGLRLEAQLDGMPAIAGSYKKHPLNGGRLPAEMTGMSVLGDELLSVNGVSLEGISFDDIIATVRQVGTDAAPTAPLCMRFRPVLENRRRLNSDPFTTRAAASFDEESAATSRRTKEEILGIKSQKQATAFSLNGDVVSTSSGVEGSGNKDDLNRSQTVLDGTDEMQQEFSRIIANLQNVLPITSYDLQDRLVLLPWTQGVGAPDSDRLRGAALLVVAVGSTLHAVRLEVAVDSDSDMTKCTVLGKVNVLCEVGKEITSTAEIRRLTVVKTGTESWCVIVWDSEGQAQLVLVDILLSKQILEVGFAVENSQQETLSMSTDLRASFRCYPMFDAGKCGTLTDPIILRGFSVDLVAALVEDDSHPKIIVWNARPLPGTAVTASDDKKDATAVSSMYGVSVIALQHDCDIVDFRFISTNALDTNPLIAVFTNSSVFVYQSTQDLREWDQVLEVSFSGIPGSSVSTSPTSNLLRCPRESPVVTMPHILPLLRNMSSRANENDHLKPEWHPDSILAAVCAEQGGTKQALKKRLRGIYSWLAAQEDGSIGLCKSSPLSSIIPLCFFETQELDEDLDDRDGQVESAQNMFSTLATITSTEEDPKKKQKEGLRRLLSVLSPGSKKNADSSRRTTLAPSTDSELKTSADLPSPLQSLNGDELRCLWVVGEILLKPPRFGELDTPAQLALFCMTFMKLLEQAEDDEEESAAPSPPSRAQDTFLAPGATVEPSENKPKLPIPSSACIAALVSNSQSSLVESCRPSALSLNWDAAKALRLPFWIRSDQRLKMLSEEIGQNVYRQTRSIMDCALFFIITGNMKKLRNLAATDQSDTGKKFFKFITKYDFSSERGRKAAEKNAFSLLKKHQHTAAASFFLLPEPPMLKTALEAIIIKNECLDLAFLVARLVEHSASGPSPLGSMGLAMMGGGGGYAGESTMPESAPVDDVPFSQWKPKLGKAGKRLLRHRGLEMARDDPCLIALQLIWLSRPEEAAHVISGSVTREEMNPSTRMAFPPSFDAPVPQTSEVSKRKSAFPVSRSDSALKPETTNARVAKKTNDVLNFASRPMLTKAIGASARAKMTCTILVGQALAHRGIELSSAQTLLSNAGSGDVGEEPSTPSVDVPVVEHSSKPVISTNVSAPQSSSIFDGFDAKPPKPKKQTPSTTEMASSIFDSFDVPPAKSKSRQPAPSAEKASSIFDSFEPPPQKPKPTPSSQSGEMSSSIFDSFNAAPQMPKTMASPQTGDMVSSIFDTFDTGPQKAQQQATNNSSIFDDFDPVPAAKRSSVSSQDTEARVKASPGHNVVEEEPEEPDLPGQTTPPLYEEWRNHVLNNAMACRLLREVARIIDKFHGNIIDPPIAMFQRPNYPLVPSSTAEVLRTYCDGDELLTDLKSSLEAMSRYCHINGALIVEQALRLLDTKAQPNSIVVSVLLHSMLDQIELAEDVVRDASLCLIQRCEALALSNDDLMEKGRTIHHVSSQYMRRLCSRESWQLELCLWLQRSGALPLSTIVVKETIVAVRAGLFLASWGRNHECLEDMLRCEPDCEMDQDGGRQLWSSLKLISGLEERPIRTAGLSSGGWEFLVDCRRDEATQMLKPRFPGSFLIRPHARDNSVFTLSFKTNLVPSDVPEETPESKQDDADEKRDPSHPKGKKPVKKEDVVQHAIMRLSDAGFRCGSFGPFTSLMDLLEAVSSSLPFDLLFDKPPTGSIIKEKDSQPSPNAFFLRKFALSSHKDDFKLKDSKALEADTDRLPPVKSTDQDSDKLREEEAMRLDELGLFSQLLTLTEIRKQLCAVAAAAEEDPLEAQSLGENAMGTLSPQRTNQEGVLEKDDLDSASVGSISMETSDSGLEEQYSVASRIVRPLLTWCRAMELRVVYDIAPALQEVSLSGKSRESMALSETAIEVGSCIDGGDAILRTMIQPNSGVGFRTLKIGEGGDSAMIILFSKADAAAWLVSTGVETEEKDALERLARMEERRVIEAIAHSDLSLKDLQKHAEGEEDSVSYRIVDPWEVEVVNSRAEETAGASLGRERYFAFSVSAVVSSCEEALRRLGRQHLLALWTNSNGSLHLTKAIASVHPPWERDAGGDLAMVAGVVTETSSYSNSVRQHLYRNSLFRRLRMPQRFMALVQVELLDLKNLSSSGSSLSVYALLRLKRPGSSAPLSLKARTLDSAATQPVKITKISGTPNAPASWGSVVRFRYPLPEDVNSDGVCYDDACEALFKGSPSILQFSVYEKKFMSDIELGGADVKLDALTSGGQLEEWVPLRSEKDGINWFARIRLTLRFELMCVPTEEDDPSSYPPSVGLRKIQELSKSGGVHEDAKHVKSASTPDLLSYFESYVY